MLLSLIVFQEIFFSVAVFAAEEKSPFRSAYLLAWKNKRLAGHVVKQFETPSLISCSHSCLRNSWCTSTNFKESFKKEDKGTCELNKHEIAPINGDTRLIDQPGFTFSLFLKGCLMSGCSNGGFCLFDKINETFTCSCKLPWSGDKCQVRMAIEFTFTTLNATGKDGPTSNIGYKGSSLENVTVTNGLQEWSAPLTGWYYVDMCGASGEDSSKQGKKGGKGARVTGTVHLDEGTKLVVLVGQQEVGGVYSGSGGGGSFVVFASNRTPLSIAGGGGGATRDNDGGPGQAGEAEGLKNGTIGQGGIACLGGNYDPFMGWGPGAGFRGDGKCCNNASCNGAEGKSFFTGGTGGRVTRDGHNGGFGGGGAAGFGLGGGGGGYSGGSVIGDIFGGHSGGGGSFVSSTHGNKWSAQTAACGKGDGYVIFRFLGQDSPLLN